MSSYYIFNGQIPEGPFSTSELAVRADVDASTELWDESAHRVLRVSEVYGLWDAITDIRNQAEAPANTAAPEDRSDGGKPQPAPEEQPGSLPLKAKLSVFAFVMTAVLLAQLLMIALTEEAILHLLNP